jgi:hypothetical protein
MMPLGLAMHPGAQQTHQDVKDKVSRGSNESHRIEARLRKKCPRRVLHQFSEAVDGGDDLVGRGS